MKQNITTQDLVKFLYGETDLTTSLTIKDELIFDRSLSEKFEQLSAAKDSVKDVAIEPSGQVLNAILNYAQSTSLEAEFYY